MRTRLRPAPKHLPIAIGLLTTAVIWAIFAASRPIALAQSDGTSTPPPTSDSTPVPPQPGMPPAEETATPPQVLVEALVGEIRKLNPLLASYNPVDRDITALIFEGLTTTNAYGEIIPLLAESWRVSDDGLQYLVRVRDDVLWHDGVPFSAVDVVFTTQLLSAPDFPGPAELHEFWRTVEVDVLDERTVRFRLTQPLASFPDQLRIGIVPEHVLRGVSGETLAQHPFNLDPIGTGPYQFEALTASTGNLDGVQLRLAPVYRQRPDGAEGFALERIVFRTYPSAEAALEAFAANEVNSIGHIPPALLLDAQRVSNLSLYAAVAPQVGVLIYNWDRDSVSYVRNPRVRLALAHAVDRAALVARHLAGAAIVADSPLLPNSWAYDPAPWPAYDLARAQQLMETAGAVFEAPAEAEPEADTEATDEPMPDGETSPAEDTAPGDGEAEGEGEAPESTPTPTETPPAPPERAMTILVPDDAALEALAGDLAAAWEQLGFSAGVDPVSPDEMKARLERGDFDMALVELSFEPYADPDPYVFWHQGQSEDGQNYGAMDDRRISEALENARREPHGVNRAYYYSRFQELFAQRVPALVLYYPLYIYGADSHLDGVELGFLSAPSDRFRTIRAWRFVE